MGALTVLSIDMIKPFEINVEDYKCHKKGGFGEN